MISGPIQFGLTGWTARHGARLRKRWLPIVVMLAAFAATRFFSVNIILIILVCGVIGALDTLYLQKKEEGK